MTAKVKHESRKTKSKAERIPREAGPRCTHFWIIERPFGPTSKGVCKYCGELKEFLNEPSLSFNPRIFDEEVFGPGEGVSDDSHCSEDEMLN